MYGTHVDHRSMSEILDQRILDDALALSIMLFIYGLIMWNTGISYFTTVHVGNDDNLSRGSIERIHNTYRGNVGLVPTTSYGSMGLFHITSSGRIGLVQNTSSGSMGLVHNTSSGSMGLVHITSSGRIGLVQNTSSGSMGLVHNTSSGSIGLVHITSSGRIGLVQNTSSGSMGLVHNTSSGSMGLVHITSSGRIGLVQNTSSGSMGLVHNTSSGSIGLVHTKSSGSIGLVQNTSSGSMGLVHNTSSGSIGLVHITSSSRIGLVQNTSSGSMGLVHNTSSGSIGLVHTKSSGRIGLVQNTSSGSMGQVHNISSGSIGLVHTKSSGSIGLVQNTSSGSMGLVHNISSGSIGLVHTKSSGSIGPVHTTSSDSIVLVHSTFSCNIGLVHNTFSGSIGLVHNTFSCSIELVHNTFSCSLGLVHNTFSGSIGLVHNTFSCSIELVHNTFSCSIGLVHNTFSGSIGLVHNTSSGSIGLVHTMPSGIIGLVHSPSSGIIGLVHSPSSGSIGLVHTTSRDNIGLVHTPSSGSIGLVHDTFSCSIGLVYNTFSSSKGLIHNTSSVSIGLVHTMPSGSILVHSPSSGSIGLVHTMSRDSIGLVHNTSSGIIGLVHTPSSGSIGLGHIISGFKVDLQILSNGNDSCFPKRKSRIVAIILERTYIRVQNITKLCIQRLRIGIVHRESYQCPKQETQRGCYQRPKQETHRGCYQRPKQDTGNSVLPTDTRSNTVNGSNIDYMQYISSGFFSIWQNGSLDKLSNIDCMQPISCSLFSIRQHGSFDNSSKRYSETSCPVSTLHCCRQPRFRTTVNIPSALFDDNRNIKTSNVFQTFRQLGEEMQRNNNILHYTSILYFSEIIIHKYQHKHISSHKPDVDRNRYIDILSKLMSIVFYTYCISISLYKNIYYIHKFYSAHPSFFRKICWFMFCVLNTCFHFSAYFPNVLLFVHKMRNELLQNVYPMISPAYKAMIMRRYKKYKRDITRTKVKEFFEFHTKWLKAFDLKQKYVRSANVTDTYMTMRRGRRNQLRGGRKRKCSFRKSGPFIHGKLLYKRHTLQRKSLLERAFKSFMNSLQNGLNQTVRSTQWSVTKTGKMTSDAANSIMDMFRLRRIPRQTPIIVRPFLGSSIENEFARVATYAAFPTGTPVSTLRLARAGFFYTGQSDVVECFHCHVKHGKWKKDDIPLEVHKRISPSCDFVLGNDTENTSIDRSSIQSGPYTSLFSGTSHTQSQNGETSVQLSETSGELQTLSSAYPSTGSECVEELSSDSIGYSNQCTEQSLSMINQQESGEHHQILEAASPTSSSENREHSTRRDASGISLAVVKSELQNKPTHSNSTKMAKKTKSQKQHVTTVQLRPLSQCHDRPKHMAYAVITVRMSSFKGWSSYTGQTPRELAAAGLFYSGYADLVRCWFCGVSLQSWETNDDPWIEHTKWAPTCLFLRRSKGDEFILLVHERNNLCSHSAKSNEETNMSSIQYAPDETQTPLQLAASVESVKTMGYSTGAIQKAIEKLQRDNTPVDTNSIVNELLADDGSYFSSIKPDPAKVSELTWNAAGHATEVNSCANGITAGMRNLDVQNGSRLMEETRRQQQDLKCKICMDVDAVITFVPCCHVVCCEDCGYAVSKCPVCRGVIETRVKTWMS